MARDDLKVARGRGVHLGGRVRLEAEEEFEEGGGGAGADGQVQDVAAGAQHARQLAQARGE